MFAATGVFRAEIWARDTRTGTVNDVPVAPTSFSPSRFSTDEMLDDLRRLVEVESPSHEPGAIERSAAAVAELIDAAPRHAGRARRQRGRPARPLARARRARACSLVGHHDTVFPIGALAARPFTVADGRVTGPGVFDMKGGIVLAVHAVAALADRSGLELLFSSDEEVGSRASRALIEERAAACGAVLVLEPAGDGGALKIGRKGVGTFEVTVQRPGRPRRSRAGEGRQRPRRGGAPGARHRRARRPGRRHDRHPDGGARRDRRERRAGGRAMRVDVRVTSMDEAARIEAAMAALTSHDPEATITVTGQREPSADAR